MIHNIGRENSLLNQYVAEIRSSDIQSDRARFRRNLERLGEIFAYEISKTLQYEKQQVETPLGVANVAVPKDRIVVASILRAGLPFHTGILNRFEYADNAFISAYRMHHKDGTFEIKMGYITCPQLEDKVLILCDTMLATGSSIQKTLEVLQENYNPKEIHLAVVIASSPGLEFIRRLYPNIHIWMAAVDEELTAKSYIVPGLGDAGDLAFGGKTQE